MAEFYAKKNVLVLFPPEEAEQSAILLVYDPNSAIASKSIFEKTKSLNDVFPQVAKMVKDVGAVKTELFAVEKKWHRLVSGKLSGWVPLLCFVLILT